MGALVNAKGERALAVLSSQLSSASPSPASPAPSQDEGKAASSSATKGGKGGKGAAPPLPSYVRVAAAVPVEHRTTIQILSCITGVMEIRSATAGMEEEEGENRKQ